MTLAPPVAADRLDVRGIDPAARETIIRLARFLSASSEDVVTIGDVVTRLVSLHRVTVAATRDSGEYPPSFLLSAADLPGWIPPLNGS